MLEIMIDYVVLSNPLYGKKQGGREPIGKKLTTTHIIKIKPIFAPRRHIQDCKDNREKITIMMRKFGSICSNTHW